MADPNEILIRSLATEFEASGVPHETALALAAQQLASLAQEEVVAEQTIE